MKRKESSARRGGEEGGRERAREKAREGEREREIARERMSAREGGFDLFQRYYKLSECSCEKGLDGLHSFALRTLKSN